jgi:thiol-disulfide isomerase/thioredoxin
VVRIFPSLRSLVPAVGCALATVMLAIVPAESGVVAAQKSIPEVPAPELDGGVAWINTGKPIKLRDLRGKVVLLDFWTFCCINCMHIMPDLAKLEEKYKNELVVIGVHSGKFENEKSTENIRKAVLRYELKHPVVNDADKKIWRAYQCEWWPTIAIIDPEGKIVAGAAGETTFNYQTTDRIIGGLVQKHRRNKTLDETPIRFDTAKFRDQPDTPLYFPGKIVVDAKGKRLLIADSTHHRIVVTDLDGKKIAIAGTGYPGNKDGAFDKAQFDDPQGMAILDDTIYVADRKNNCIRQLDLKTQTVKTVPGTTKVFSLPKQSKTMQCTPWDVWLDGQRLFVAMSGAHQIWVLDLRTHAFAPFAGDQSEEIKDGPRQTAKFAQPSGLTSDGKFLYIADAEVSAVRKVALNGAGPVETLVGRGLFAFGDRDGPGQVVDEQVRRTTEALLQHCVGIAYHDHKLFVADTYNSKIKTIDLETGIVSTFLGGPANAGADRVLNEPTGLAVADDKLYVADTNSHRIQVVDLKTKEVKTLELKGVPPVEIRESEPKKK